jgi:hypothetical protein
MAKLEIEVDDATGLPKELPEALKKHVDTLVTSGVDKGFKARHAELRTQLEEELTKKLGKGGELTETERARVKALEEELERHRIADAERKKDYDAAQKIREEAEAKREAERKQAEEAKDKEITRRDGRLREMARSEIKIAAKTLGARDESLDELASILGANIDLDADLNPFVKGEDGKPAVDDKNQPVTIEGYVKAYLDKKPHHRAPAGGTGGGARGGASLTNLTGPALLAQQKLEAAQAELAKNPTSNAAVNKVLAAKRELVKAASGK